jgi:hypothetical protein
MAATSGGSFLRVMKWSCIWVTSMRKHTVRPMQSVLWAACDTPL